MAARTKNFQISFRVTEEVKAAVEQAAKDDARTVSSLAESLVLEHLRKNGYLRASLSKKEGKG